MGDGVKFFLYLCLVSSVCVAFVVILCVHYHRLKRAELLASEVDTEQRGHQNQVPENQVYPLPEEYALPNYSTEDYCAEPAPAYVR